MNYDSTVIESQPGVSSHTLLHAMLMKTKSITKGTVRYFVPSPEDQSAKAVGLDAKF
jgi:hypothetical protein